MSFEIIIKETKEIVKTCEKSYEIIREEEVEREKMFVNPGETKTRIENIYGYTPEIHKKVEVQSEIFRQTVEELDLASVIKAVNKL